MELYSFQFIIFVIIALICHEIAGHRFKEKQWIVRLAISICFILMLVTWRVVFILCCAATVFFGARLLEKAEAKGKALRKQEGLSKEDKNRIKAVVLKKKRCILALVLAFNVGLLFTLKYFIPAEYSSILVPLGISYYTFMAIAYFVDVYGGKYKAESNYFKILLYISWFPQLIQGPINRYDKQSQVLFGRYSITWDCFKEAAFLFLYGALKKYAIANLLNYPVAKIFERDLANTPGSLLLFGAFLFAIQQYADFSGGIDMVMGVSMSFGVSMDENFRQPYFSKSLAQFWRRWHITLGSFMRDYVFYPFALCKPIGNMMKKLSDKHGQHFGRAIVGGIGNILVFTLVGLWHGPKLHYIVWGLYNGIIIAVSDFLSPAFERAKDALHIKSENKVFGLFQMLRTFLIIVLAGYFDRIEDVMQGIICFKNTILHFCPEQFYICILELYEWEAFYTLKDIVVIISCLFVLVFSILKETGHEPFKLIKSAALPVRWLVIYVMMILLLAGFALNTEEVAFMYAQF